MSARAADVRRVQALDQRHVEELVELFDGEWWTRGRSAGDVRRLLDGSTAVVAFVERSSDRLVGFARLLSDGVVKALVLDVIVAPKRRGDGLGRLLVEAVLEETRGVAHVELYCREELRPFYRRFGFEVPTDVGLMRAEARDASARAAP